MGRKPDLVLPRDKNDVTGATAALKCGLPTLEPALPALLRWLRNPSWPVAGVIRPFFSTHGEAALPHVKRALASRDALWKANLLQTVVSHWDRALVVELNPALELLVTTFDGSGTDLAAFELLVRHPNFRSRNGCASGSNSNRSAGRHCSTSLDGWRTCCRPAKVPSRIRPPPR